MKSEEKIKSVFENLRMRFHNKGGYYAANESSDVWYFLIPNGPEDNWILKVGMGVWDDGTVFVDADGYRRKMWLINVLTVAMILLFLPFFFIYSLFWIGSALAVVLTWVLPRYAILKAKWKIIPKLRAEGITTEFQGVVYLVQPEFEQRGGINSVSLRPTP